MEKFVQSHDEPLSKYLKRTFEQYLHTVTITVYIMVIWAFIFIHIG